MGQGVSISKIFIKTNLQLPAGVNQAEANIPRISSQLSFCSARDFSFYYIFPQILLAQVVVKWNEWISKNCKQSMFSLLSI